MSLSSNVLDESSRDLLRQEEPFDDEIQSPVDQEFPSTSIRVLLVDSDLKSLRLMTSIMTKFSYQVTSYGNGDEALAFLKKSKHEIDLVIWDFHVPEVDGLKALNTVGKEMDLPVVIMSHGHDKETVMKSIKYGACDFLVKPVSKEVIAVLWRHVYHKKMSKSGLITPKDSVDDDDNGLGQDNNDLYQSTEEGSSKNVEDSGEQDDFDRKGERNTKKPRMTWTPELHEKFEKAIQRITIEKAVPKLILKYMQEEMNVQGLTRNNVASHLQKYRLGANKKNQEARQASGWFNNAVPNAALTASKPLLNSHGINLHNGPPYYMNDHATANAPIHYPPSGFLTTNHHHHFMSNSSYMEPFRQPQQLPQQQLQQQYYHSSPPLPSMTSNQEHGHASSATEIPGLIYPTLSHDLQEYFLPPDYNNDFNGQF
ncbi:unnamed protein product [Microthlaspi erraticum]|uniref:Response regulatory domain-containing protein n=1 Tax=Microthlaspi erraticum TaxID=1685480 RepID=A0A6D2IV88_9BRAS|nr:unnamed protein product [Microthlaspi erraticum]